MPYAPFDPNEKVSSPGSGRHTMKVRNQATKSGKFSIKIGSGNTELETISRGVRKEYDVGGHAVTLINKGAVQLEWLRST